MHETAVKVLPQSKVQNLERCLSNEIIYCVSLGVFGHHGCQSCPKTVVLCVQSTWGTSPGHLWGTSLVYVTSPWGVTPYY